MAQIVKGETITDVAPGKTVTSTRLNNLVDAATLLNGAVLDQSEKTTPISADYVLLGDSTLAASAAPKKVQVGNLQLESQRNGSQRYVASDTGAANAYVVALSPAATAYATGMEVRFKAGASNTTTSTINVNSLGVKTILTRAGANLAANDILAGQIVTLVYDGTYFQHISALSAAEVTATQCAESLRGSAQQYAADTNNTANTYVATLAPVATAYTTGMVVRFKTGAAGASTGASTLNVNGLGTKAVQKNSAALVAGDIGNNQLVTAIYDGTAFQIQGINTANGFTTTASLASATVPGSNARIINAVAHNLGAIPTRVRGVLRCATAENGFAIGDEVDFSAITAGNLTVMVNATTVTVLQTSLTINIGKNAATLGTPTAITVGSWTVAIYLNL